MNIFPIYVTEQWFSIKKKSILEKDCLYIYICPNLTRIIPHDRP